MLDIEAQGFLAYLSLTDQRAFEDFIVRMAARAELEGFGAVDIDKGRVYRVSEDMSVVLREGVAMLVFVERPERAPRDYTTTIATIDPREALSHTEAFGWARAQVQDQDDGMIFVEPGRLLAQIEAEAGRAEGRDYGLRYAQDELDRARAAGESAEYIRELELRLEEERRWQREREARESGRRDLVRDLFGPIGAVVAAAELRDDAIEGHANVRIPGEGLLKQLFVPVEAESPLLRALDEPAMMVLDGRAHMPTVLALAEVLAKLEGVTLTKANEEISRELGGVDVLGELVPALTGAGGLVVTQRRAPDPKRLGEAPKSLGVGAYLELSKPDVYQRLFEDLTRDKRVPGLRRAGRGGGWKVAVPEWNELYIDVVGTQLVVSTDDQLAERIRDARTGAQAETLAAADHPLRGPFPAPSLRMYQRWEWMMIMDAHEPWVQDAESMLYDLNTHHVLNPDEAAKVPRSKKFKRKYKELEAVMKELNAFERKRAERDFERMLEVGRSLGDAGLQVEARGDGLAMHMLWRMAPQTTPLDLLYRLFMIGGSNVDWAEHERIMGESYRIREELSQIRQADLDAAAAKRSPSK